MTDVEPRRPPARFPRLWDAKKPVQVAALLEESILRGDFRPGERIPTEMELAEQMNVSRTVVRDAAKILTTKGLLEVHQGRGTLVAAPTADAYADTIDLLLARSTCTVGDAYQARAVLDRQLAPVVAQNATDEDFDELYRAASELDAGVARSDWKAAEQAHVDFHLAFIKGVQMPALEVLLAPIHKVLLLTNDPPSLDDARLWYIEEHYGVARAARTRDPEALQAAIDAHYSFIDDPAFQEIKGTPLARVRPFPLGPLSGDGR
jgi:GntR family transcriptional regulator, transcriptional repressor for pyruvate dehydrogenase complex